MAASKEFLIVAKRGTIFNLQDCGIPLDITDHTPVDLMVTATENERESSMQLRHALREGALINIAPKEVKALPAVPEPIFTIPDLKVTVDGGGSLSSPSSIKKVEHKHAPDTYEISGTVSQEVMDQITSGIAKNKEEDFTEQQRILSEKAEEDEEDTELIVRTGKKAVPELPQGTVDGKPIGYEFKAPLSPALDAANAGMGNGAPASAVTDDPLNPEDPKVKKTKIGKGAKKQKVVLP